MQHNFAIAVKAVIMRENKVLLLRRSALEMQHSYLNKHQKWDFPGGGLRFYEDVQQGLMREIFEETQLHVQVENIISCFDVIRPQIHLCILTYIAKWKKGTVHLSKEHESFVWMTEQEVQESSLPKWMKRDIQKVFTQHKNEKTTF